MSEPMKTRRTDRTQMTVKIMFEGRHKRLFLVPKDKAENFAALLKEYETQDSIPAAEVFKDLHEKYGRVGTIVRGYRMRDGLSQVELAKKISIRQSELSSIENGKRTVGKAMAKRLAVAFKTDYRVFL